MGGYRAIIGLTAVCGTRLFPIPAVSVLPPPSLPWSVAKRKQPGGAVAAAAAVSRVAAALRGVGMDVASARVDEPVPPPDTSGLLDGAVPVGADGEGGGGEAAGGGTEAAGGGAAAGGAPAVVVAPVVSEVPEATEGATDAGGSGPAAVPPPEATAAAPSAAEATSPTAGEVGLCTLRCLLANSTEFRMSAPPETSVRDVKTQILTQQPPRTLGGLGGWGTPVDVVHAFLLHCVGRPCVLCVAAVVPREDDRAFGQQASDVPVRMRVDDASVGAVLSLRSSASSAGYGWVRLAAMRVRVLAVRVASVRVSRRVAHCFVSLPRTALCGPGSRSSSREQCPLERGIDDPYCCGLWHLVFCAAPRL